jgi:adenylate cyclase
MSSLLAVELAARAGVPMERVETLTRLGILQPDDAGEYPEWELGVIRLTEAFEEGGISLEAISRAIAEGHFSFAFVQFVFREGYRGLTDETFEEICTRSGADMSFVQQVFTSAGLPTPQPGDRIRHEDAERIPNLSGALQFGSGDPALLLRGVRIMGESTHRIAESQPYLYHKLMEEPLMRSGVSEREMRDLITAVSPALGDTAERALVWMYRRHEEHATIEHLLEHLYGLMEEVGLQETRTDHPPAICFLDLAGYTRLTEERGDEAAAQTVSALADVVRDTSGGHRGRPVKWLGDGVMFHFHDPEGAVQASLEMVERIPAEGLPPAHVGIAAGPIIARDGDYFGRTVNTAARIASYAGPGQVLVTDEVSHHGTGHVSFEEVGEVLLKGLSKPLRLHRALHAG